PCRPPWWPHNEPWPPRREGHRNRVSREVFFRRAGMFALLMLMPWVAGLVAIAWWIVGASLPARARASAAMPLAVLVGAALVVAGLLAVVRRMGMPLGSVMEAADRVAAGDYGVRVAEAPGPPALRALARAFNTMTARLQDHDRLRRDLMADVAHELRTPLTV